MSSPPDVSFDARTETRPKGSEGIYSEEATSDAAVLGQWGQF